MNNILQNIMDEQNSSTADRSNDTGNFSLGVTSTTAFIDTTITNNPLHHEIPQCKDINPYVLKNDGWIPQHIIRADRAVYTLLTVYMVFLTMGALILNGIVVVASWKTKALRTPLNYIIVNLAVADIFAGFVGGMVSIMANGAGYFFMGKFMCQFEGYTVSVFGCVGLNSIAVMAFERFFVVCKPFGQIRFTNTLSNIGLATTWIWGVIWNTPPLIFWDGYDPEGLGTSCAPNWFVKEYGPRMFLVNYFIFGFLLPLAIIVICYGKLLWTLRQVSKENQAGGKSAETEVARMVVVMVTAFVIAWLPYASFAMYNVANPDAQIDYSLGAIPAFFAKTATLYNPLIYIGLNRQFRDSVIRMFFGGKNPWVEEAASSSMMSSQVSSQVTTVSTNKVAPA